MIYNLYNMDTGTNYKIGRETVWHKRYVKYKCEWGMTQYITSEHWPDTLELLKDIV